MQSLVNKITVVQDVVKYSLLDR